MSQTESSVERGSNRRVIGLIVFLNVILLGWLLFASLGRRFMPSEGASLVVINDTFVPMIEMKLTYPGGEFAIPRLSPKQSVGNPARARGEFEATLSFRDEAGNSYRETVKIKPVGEFLILLHVLPVLDEATVTTAEQKEEKVLKASTSKVRILPSYRGENTNI